MSMKERLKIHRQIEAENERKLKEWKERRKTVGGISEVFYTHDRKFCFQRVGNYWRLYGGEDGHFIYEYRSFVAVQEHIMKARGTCPYEDPFVFEEDSDED